jgi:hypothetical protein
MKLDLSWSDRHPTREPGAKTTATHNAGAESITPPVEADRLAGLDDETRREVQTFVDVLGAQVVGVIPRGAADREIAGSVGSAEEQVFASGRRTPEEIAERAAQDKRERINFIAEGRRVSHGWMKWLKWHAWSPADAEEYRREHEDGANGWLLALAARRTPLGKRSRTRGV